VNFKSCPSAEVEKRRIKDGENETKEKDRQKEREKGKKEAK
jgi:hypothetical protein